MSPTNFMRYMKTQDQFVRNEDGIHFTRMVAAARGKRTTAKINGQAVEDEKSWNYR